MSFQYNLPESERSLAARAAARDAARAAARASFTANETARQRGVIRAAMDAYHEKQFHLSIARCQLVRSGYSLQQPFTHPVHTEPTEEWVSRIAEFEDIKERMKDDLETAAFADEICKAVAWRQLQFEEGGERRKRKRDEREKARPKYNPDGDMEFDSGAEEAAAIKKVCRVLKFDPENEPDS